MPRLASRATPERIVEVACDVLDREGADAVSMRTIADVVGITAMAIYRHYESRDALLERVAEVGFAELVEESGRVDRTGPARERILELFERFRAYAVKRPHMFELMFAAKRAGARKFPGDFKARRSPTANVLVDAIGDAIRDRAIVAEDPWEVAVVLNACAHGLITLQRGGRIGLGAAEFRALYRRSLERVLGAFAA